MFCKRVNGECQLNINWYRLCTVAHITSFIAVLSLSAGVFIGCSNTGLNKGIAAGQQYIPSNLHNTQLTALGHLAVDLRDHDYHVDGVRINKTRVYLQPEKHTISYKVYGITEEWKTINARLVSQGFEFEGQSVGNVWVKRVGGIEQRVEPVGIKKYAWSTKSVDFIAVGGNTYYLSELINK